MANNSDSKLDIDFKRIKVINLAQELSENQIDKLFRKFGKIEDIYLPINPNDNEKNNGFCYIK